MGVEQEESCEPAAGSLSAVSWRTALSNVISLDCTDTTSMKFNSSDSFFRSSSESIRISSLRSDIILFACCRSAQSTSGMVSNVVVVSLAVMLTSGTGQAVRLLH